MTLPSGWHPAVAPGEPMIRLDRVYKIHQISGLGVAALGGVSLQVERGQFVAIVGPSGAGKSTVLTLIGALDSATAGHVSVAGRDLTLLDRGERSEYRRHMVGFLWQGATKNLVPYLTVADNVLLPLMLSGHPATDARRRVDDLLSLFGLSDRRDHQPRRLSGGEQQLTALAVALANRPAIVLADEPTAEVDAVGGRRVVDSLRQACDELGATVVMTTHDLLAAANADRTFRLVDGRIRSAAGRGHVDASGRVTLPKDSMGISGPADVDVEIEGDEIRIRPTEGDGRARPEHAVPSPGPRPADDEGRIDRSTEQVPSIERADAASPLVGARGVTRTYAGASEVPALQDVSVALSPGEMIVLIGPSGSGKSTLLALLAGLDEPDGGTVLWDGRSLDRISEAERIEHRSSQLALILQSRGLLPTLSARENVMLPLLMRRQTADDASRAAEAWLHRLGIEQRVDHRLHELSAGEQRRVAVARGLAPGPRVVLADEPTAEVDARGAAVILTALRSVAESGGAVLVASHDPRVLRWASRVIVLRDGRVEAEGTEPEVAGRISTD
jgi:ABC-type lipoprotein export system ATPase subunit